MRKYKSKSRLKSNYSYYNYKQFNTIIIEGSLRASLYFYFLEKFFWNHPKKGWKNSPFSLGYHHIIILNVAFVYKVNNRSLMNIPFLKYLHKNEPSFF